MEIPMVDLCCCVCGITFAITEGRFKQLKKCHDNFYCPSGHSQYFPQKTEKEKLREELKRKNREIEELKSKKRKKK